MERKLVGMFNGEIFIAEVDHKAIDGKTIYCVIRPVSKSQLEDLRDVDYWIDNEDDLWREAVKAGETEQGLKEWMTDFVDWELTGNDEEFFPMKDCSFCECLDDDSRKMADDWLKENEDMEVGTWEASGCFPPSFTPDHNTFDVVFDTELANECYSERL